MDPTLKNYFIFFNTSMSLLCNYIANIGFILITINMEISFAILTEKLDSAYDFF